ncbi:MAG TPA: hypothetical protein VFT13_07655 [Candidatus Krumholzibacteria bacterium]|nr:hypothetical protein [Candidatus Krumholzibacteria bacterium]
MALATALVLAGGPARVGAQPPGSDIWLAPLTVTPGGVEVGVGMNATNRPGYDNQPFFLSGGAFLYSAGDSAGTDVWRWDGAAGRAAPVTRTPESEYSPTPLPGGAPGFCAVRVEADSTQRLWRFDMDGGNARPLMTDVDSVGYFEWLDDTTLAIFVVGDPHTLRIVDVPSQRETVVARDIGRFIRCVPGTRDVAFTLRNPDDTHRFFVFSREAEAPAWLIDAPGSGQDAVWAGDVLLATNDTEILMARPATGGTWQRLADVRGWGPASATRLAVSPALDRIAVVCAEPASP